MTTRTTGGWASLARLLGAILYGQRPQDEGARKKARRLVASGSAASLVLWLVVEMWGVTKASIYDERDQHRAQVATIVQAMDKQTEAIGRQTQALERVADEQAGVFAILLDRISGPLPARPVPQARIIRPRAP